MCGKIGVKWGEVMAFENIKKLRTRAKMTQWELGERLGVSASAIGMYEQGRREPDSKILMKLSKIFSVSVDEIMGSSEICDINELCDDFLTGLSFRELSLGGEALSEEEFSAFESSMRLTLEITTRKILEGRESGK